MKTYSVYFLFASSFFLSQVESQTFDVQSSSCSGLQREISACPAQPDCYPCQPQDCAYSTWSAWSAPSDPVYVGSANCTELCGRTRKVVVENNDCGVKCAGSLVETKVCAEPNCHMVPYDCLFTTWTEWSSCAAGAAHSTRTRSVQKEAIQGGTPCVGSMVETKPCVIPTDDFCTFVPWSDWSTCGTVCGEEGVSTRSRAIQQHASRIGKPCAGALEQERNCSAASCEFAVPCSLGEWSAWTTCDKSKNELQRSRKRTWTAASLGAAPCQGLAEETLEETQPCDVPVPTTCVLSLWTAWTACSKDCGGGQQTRSRHVATAASNGGACPSFESAQTQPCMTQKCASDCTVGPWQDWEACPVTCGSGNITRTRSVFVDGQANVPVNPKDNRLLCPNAVVTEIGACKTPSVCLPTDCQWSQWTVTPCSVTCGEGVQRKYRSIEKMPQAGGSCPESDDNIVLTCTLPACPSGCKNGTWSAWQEWGDCSQTCGSSFRSRSRSVETPPNHCGYPAVGVESEFATCPGGIPCSQFEENVDCEVSMWSAWGVCAQQCGATHTRTRTITTPAKGIGKSCGSIPLSEVEQCTKENSPGFIVSCGGPIPTDCQFTDWTETACSATCGGGYWTRKREIKSPSTNGGASCKGNLTRVEACNAFPCNSNEQCVDCSLGQWSAWDACSSCEGQTERRRIISPANFCGKECTETSMVETTSCSVVGVGCAEEVTFCTWGEWGSPTPAKCPHTCGRHLVTKTRSLVKVSIEPASYLSKAGKDYADTLTCEGSQNSNSWCGFTICQDPAEADCQPQDCYPTEWSDWSAPSDGLCSRTRRISQQSSCGGNPCNGTLSGTKLCAPPQIPTDCVLGEWSMWTQCHDTVSQVYRVRGISRGVAFGGQPCVDALNETRPCSPNYIAPRNCSMAVWSQWSTCSSTCYGGRQQRRRDVQESAVWPGKPCDASMEEIRECMHGVACSSEPTNCSFSAWSPWGACVGNKQRVRSRTSSGGLSGGLPCWGPLMETGECESAEVDCVVGDWTNWGDCDLTCGIGTKQRHRQVMTQPKGGGKTCPPALVEVTPCSHNECFARIDCELTSWREWTYCTTTCGVGQKMRTRYVSNNRSSIGEGCNNSLMETRPCDGERKSCVFDSECRWSDWMSWSSCSNSCGGGMSTRTRTILEEPQAGEDMMLRKCPAETEEEVKACNEFKCTPSDCIDGTWHTWSDWHVCSSSCEDGYTTRHRTMKQEASKCGKPAVGNSTEVKKCYEASICFMPVDCKLADWQEWGACSASCDGMHERSRIISTYSKNGGAACSGSTKEMATCNPSTGTSGCTPPVQDRDCVMGQWSAFSTCTVTCGGGQATRTRKVLLPRLKDGKECDAAQEETTACSTTLCNPQHAPRNCAVGEWLEWGVCNKCGGYRERKRSIAQYAQFGGTPCNITILTETGKCPRDCDGSYICMWSQWSEYSPCHVTCGNGTRQRVRSLQLLPKPQSSALYDVDGDMEARVQQLYKESMNAKAQHVREVVMAFFVGCGTLLAVLLVTQWVQKPLKRTSRAITTIPLTSSRNFEAYDEQELRDEAELLQTDLSI